MSSQELRQAADAVRARAGEASGVVLASADPETGAPLLIASGTASAVSKGFDAGAIIRAIAPHIKGGGGGRAEMAQAGGKDAGGIDAALAEARRVLGVE